MVTKREIAAAQQALNEAVARFFDARLAKLRDLAVEVGDYIDTPDFQLDPDANAQTIDTVETIIRRSLAPVSLAYDEWDRLRSTLEGEGPAVARSTSIAAAKSRLMGKQSLRRDILVMVVAHHNKWQVGMTSEQIQARIHGGTHQTVSARVSELVNTYKLLRDSGRKILTTSNSKATVWEPTDEARQLVSTSITGKEP